MCIITQIVLSSLCNFEFVLYFLCIIILQNESDDLWRTALLEAAQTFFRNVTQKALKCEDDSATNQYAVSNPDSKFHVANMGPTWGRQYPGGPHVGHMKLAILVKTK